MTTDTGSGRLYQARSRVIHLDLGQVRDRTANHATAAIPFYHPRAAPFESLFLAHYVSLRELVRHAPGPGIAIGVVHRPSAALAGRAWLAAGVGEVKSAVLGRHSQCDLLLSDPALSLRHLAFVARLEGGWEARHVGLTVVDLRTGLAFEDERGRRLEGLTAEGPVFISVGPYAVFLLPTGEGAEWPSRPAEGLAMLPPRVYLDERGAEPDRWRRGPHAMPGPLDDRTRTLITALPGPLMSGDRLLADGEAVAGTIRVARGENRGHPGAGGRLRLHVGRSALRRGLLLGRYPRCDGAALLDEPHLSRAHLLVLEVGGEIFGLDVASTEGTSLASRPLQPVRTVALGRGEAAILGRHRAYVSYHPASG